jgi:hypothetical protein
MEMKINDYLLNGRGDSSDGTFPELSKRIVCADGFSLSVQANYGAYCTPRVNNPAGGYSQVEVGFPSSAPELIMDYAECPEAPTETVYGYVPIELVEKLIELHGGFSDKQEQLTA